MNRHVSELSTLVRCRTNRIASDYYVSIRSTPNIREERGIKTVTSATSNRSGSGASFIIYFSFFLLKLEHFWKNKVFKKEWCFLGFLKNA